MYGNTVEVGRPEVVIGLNGNGVGGAFLQCDGNHLPSHTFGIPCAGAVAIALEEDGVADLFAIHEELGRAGVVRDVVDGQDVIPIVACLDAASMRTLET